MMVHVTDSFYTGVPFERPSYFGWEFTTAYTPPAMTGFQLAGVAVPQAQVLDVSQVRFFAYYFDPAGIPVLYRDETLLGTQSFLTVTVNGKVPWDLTVSYVYNNPAPPPLTLADRRSGFRWLNRNLFDDWGDTPTHLIVPENQTFELTLTINALPVPVGGTAYVGAAVHGRWLSTQEWARIKERR